ncbi:sigma-70 family RNA polymerase sigma factor [Chloroflexales bacterium ZM16-3]|nr:sigma-70 family RNA polymerase sigma factor [Chloroflexales bacterium ZM16-3]
MSHEPMPLDALCADCEQQLQSFRLRSTRDTASCDAILRQAASHDEPAISTLIQISEPLVRRNCPLRQRDGIDDWAQDVLLQIVVKMRNRESPYVVKPPPPQPFVAYRAYLKITGRNLAYDQLRAEPDRSEVSIDPDQAASGNEIADPHSDLAELERLMRFEWLLERIRKPLDREIFRMRFGLHLAPDATVELLGQQGQDVTKQQVFRSVERTIRYLSTLPEMRDLFTE